MSNPDTDRQGNEIFLSQPVRDILASELSRVYETLFSAGSSGARLEILRVVVDLERQAMLDAMSSDAVGAAHGPSMERIVDELESTGIQNIPYLVGAMRRGGVFRKDTAQFYEVTPAAQYAWSSLQKGAGFENQRGHGMAAIEAIDHLELAQVGEQSAASIQDAYLDVIKAVSKIKERLRDSVRHRLRWVVEDALKDLRTVTIYIQKMQPLLEQIEQVLDVAVTWRNLKMGQQVLSDFARTAQELVGHYAGRAIGGNYMATPEDVMQRIADLSLSDARKLEMMGATVFSPAGPITIPLDDLIGALRSYGALCAAGEVQPPRVLVTEVSSTDINFEILPSRVWQSASRIVRLVRGGEDRLEQLIVEDDWAESVCTIFALHDALQTMRDQTGEPYRIEVDDTATVFGKAVHHIQNARIVNR